MPYAATQCIKVLFLLQGAFSGLRAAAFTFADFLWAARFHWQKKCWFSVFDVQNA